MSKFVDTLNQKSADVQALALTHTLLDVLERLENQYQLAEKSVPKINQMWTNEAAKIQIVMDALKSGSRPQELLELQTLTIAESVWKTLSETGKSMLVTPQQTKEVVLNSPNVSENPNIEIVMKGNFFTRLINTFRKWIRAFSGFIQNERNRNNRGWHRTHQWDK